MQGIYARHIMLLAFITGSLSVLTNGRPTVRFGDITLCTDMAYLYIHLF